MVEWAVHILVHSGALVHEYRVLLREQKVHKLCTCERVCLSTDDKGQLGYTNSTHTLETAVTF